MVYIVTGVTVARNVVLGDAMLCYDVEDCCVEG